MAFGDPAAATPPGRYDCYELVERASGRQAAGSRRETPAPGPPMPCAFLAAQEPSVGNHRPAGHRRSRPRPEPHNSARGVRGRTSARTQGKFASERAGRGPAGADAAILTTAPGPGTARAPPSRVQDRPATHGEPHRRRPRDQRAPRRWRGRLTRPGPAPPRWPRPGGKPARIDASNIAADRDGQPRAERPIRPRPSTTTLEPGPASASRRPCSAIAAIVVKAASWAGRPSVRGTEEARHRLELGRELGVEGLARSASGDELARADTGDRRRTAERQVAGEPALHRRPGGGEPFEPGLTDHLADQVPAGPGPSPAGLHGRGR